MKINYEEISLTLELYNLIIPEESTKTLTAKKIELKLRKAVENISWLKIEKAGEVKLISTGDPF